MIHLLISFICKPNDICAHIQVQFSHCCINFDETHVTKSLEGNRGGLYANTLTNPNLPRTGLQVFKDLGIHITGVFGSSVLEPMPPILIFKTRSMMEENMKVKPIWCSNLPTVTGFWGVKFQNSSGRVVQ